MGHQEMAALPSRLHSRLQQGREAGASSYFRLSFLRRLAQAFSVRVHRTPATSTSLPPSPLLTEERGHRHPKLLAHFTNAESR